MGAERAASEERNQQNLLMEASWSASADAIAVMV